MEHLRGPGVTLEESSYLSVSALQYPSCSTDMSLLNLILSFNRQNIQSTKSLKLPFQSCRYAKSGVSESKRRPSLAKPDTKFNVHAEAASNAVALDDIDYSIAVGVCARSPQHLADATFPVSS